MNFLLMVLFLIGCTDNSEELNLYDSVKNKSNINDVLLSVIHNDSIDVHYTDYKIVSFLPQYIKRSQSEELLVKPPPYGSSVFPNMTQEFRNLDQFEFKQEDSIYFIAQEFNSKKIELNKDIFDNRTSKIVEQLENPYVYFSIPIFDSSMKYAWVKYGLNCGRLCGYNHTLILYKQNGEWKVIKRYVNWVS